MLSNKVRKNPRTLVKDMNFESELPTDYLTELMSPPLFCAKNPIVIFSALPHTI